MPVIRRVQSSRASRSNASFALEAERSLASGEVARAVEICKRGLGSFPKHPAGYVTLARAYFKLGEADRALNVLRDGYRRTGSQRLTVLYQKLAGGDAVSARDAAADAFETIPEIAATDQADVPEVNAGVEQFPETEPPQAVNETPAVETPVTAEPEIMEPEILEPGILEPKIAEPEILEPEISEPEILEPEIAEPEILEPEISEPEILEPEIAEPEILEPEIAEPEIVEPGIVEPGDAESMEAFEAVEASEPLEASESIESIEPLEASEPLPALENARDADLSDIDALDRLAARLDREHPPASSFSEAGGELVTYGEDDDSIALPEISALDMETAPIPLPPEEALEITTILQELGLGPATVERGEPEGGESVGRDVPVPERPRPLSLALHMGKSISRLRSSNLRLIPGLEFAPLRHEDQFRGQSIAPLISEPMPQPELPVRQRRISDPPVFLPLPTLDAIGAVAGEDIPPVRAERQPESARPDKPEIMPEELDVVHVETEEPSIPEPEAVPDPEPAPPIEQEPELPEPVARITQELELPEQIIQPDPDPEPEPPKLTPLEELARRLENARIPVVEDYEQRPVFEPSIVSDTLANILVAQGAYAEAMQAFQTLARVKPERFEHYQRKIWEMKYRIQNPGMPWPPMEDEQ
ncbi:MAG: hypothetical protein JWQ98_171 [Chlorobi bacterium]|nr:hypothetical protein [Chlorobiota bacterium]